MTWTFLLISQSWNSICIHYCYARLYFHWSEMKNERELKSNCVQHHYILDLFCSCKNFNISLTSKTKHKRYIQTLAWDLRQQRACMSSWISISPFQSWKSPTSSLSIAFVLFKITFWIYNIRRKPFFSPPMIPSCAINHRISVKNLFCSLLLSLTHSLTAHIRPK